MGRLAVGCLVVAVLAACGGGGLGDDDGDITWRFESTHSSSVGSGSGGGTTVVVVKTLPAERPSPLAFRLFPDVVLAVPEEDLPADLDRDGREDAVRVEEGAVRIALAASEEVLTLPVTRPAADVRAYDADGDGIDDLVVLRSDGRLDLYVGEG